MKKKLFFIVNVDWFFLSHRLPIATAAIKQGFDVTVVAGDTGEGVEIVKKGINFIPAPFQRANLNPFTELKTLIFIFKLILRHKPDVVHNVALKACLYGGFSTRFLKKAISINAVSGLGYVFTTNNITFKQKLFAKLLKLGFHNRAKVIFQNQDDINLFKELGIVNNYTNITLIKGSGVDLENTYRYIPLKDKQKVKVILPARMLYTKGVKEFCFAAKIVLKKISNIEFLLIGDIDKHNPSHIQESILKKWEKECGVKWIGYQKDMIQQYIESDIVVLPSYREGLPKTLIEACAIGRPIITTDTPGCKECVIDKQNGYLIPIKNIDILADRIITLSTNKSNIEKMGKASRLLAEKEFSIDAVIKKTLELYSQI